MKSNYLLRTAAILLIIITSCKEGKDRPNIIFILTDDHTRQAISAYGSVLDVTPNIDRLAEGGMLFENASVTNSICAPSRAVILTGKHSHINGKIDNTAENVFDSTQVTFPKILQSAGYQTAMIGKWHLRSQPTGFDFWRVLPGQGNYYNPEFITAGGQVRIEGYVTDIITDLAISWLDSIDRNKPFLLMYQHKAPHREWEPAIRHMSEYLNKSFPEPETLFDNYKGRGTAAKEAEMSILEHMRLDGDTKIHPDILNELCIDPQNRQGFSALTRLLNRYTPVQLEAWQEVYGPMNEEFKEKYPGMSEEDLMRFKYQRYMQDYLACCAAVDENIGRLLDWLEEEDLDNNTIIVYTSDQGFYLGEHGWFDKRFMYRESLGTPLIIKWPGKVDPGSRNRDLVQNLDFAQTFLEAAGIESPEEMQGMSLVPLLTGKKSEWRDAIYYHYYEYPAVHMVKRHYGVMTERYKLIHFYDDIDEWELYDMAEDPSEMNSVYDDPAYADVREELKARLKELREFYKDDTGVSF
ncbi:MAG TPA: sulfatase [Bacteroidales bacterium]|nr:sulfatase [Bacteroidales bacterium]